MNINPIRINTLNSQKSTFKSSKNDNMAVKGNYLFMNNGLTQDRFTSKVKFTATFWDLEKINIFGRNDLQMKELGEYFHKSSIGTIKEVTTFHKFFGSVDSEKTAKAYGLLQSAVDAVTTYKTAMLKELSELNMKKAKILENITEQKIRIKSEFIDNVIDEGKKENAGQNFGISNGIMVYGESKSSNESFINWLKQETPASFYKIKFNNEKPLETLAEIEKLAQDGEKSFQVNQKRSIIEVEEMDDFFADYDTLEKRTLISAFKRIEHLHQNHSTVLMRTIKPLEDFEEASIGSQRFDTKVEIKAGMSDDEEKRILELKKEIERLDKKAEDLDAKFTYEKDDPYIDRNEYGKTQYDEDIDDLIRM